MGQLRCNRELRWGSKGYLDRILGPKRIELLAADLGSVDDKEEQAWRARPKAPERAVGEIEARQIRLMRTLEVEDDPGRVVFSRVRERLAELERERRSKLDEIDGLDASPPSARSPATDLLERLPVVEAELTLAPESVPRPLFDAFRLEVLPGSWRRWQQAFEAYDSGDEAENFQAVGMRLRECDPGLPRQGRVRPQPRGVLTPHSDGPSQPDPGRRSWQLACPRMARMPFPGRLELEGLLEPTNLGPSEADLLQRYGLQFQHGRRFVAEP